MKEKLLNIDRRIDWFHYIPKHNIAYLEFGDSNNPNVIVCAHGLTRNSYDFTKLANALCDKFRIICLDYPGRGRSDVFEEKKHYNYQVYVQDSIAFLKKLGIKNCTWLGTSMGGIIGMVLASKYKKLIKSLIIQ